jgi:hypothetical protein
MSAEGGTPWLDALAKIASLTGPLTSGLPEIVGAGNIAEAALANTIEGGSIVLGGVIRGLFGTVSVGLTSTPSGFFKRDLSNRYAPKAPAPIKSRFVIFI